MNDNAHSFTTTNPLAPVGPAAALFIAGASIFEITDFEPTLQRVTIVGINLPDPDTFGPYDSYIATLVVPGAIPDTLANITLKPNADKSIWAGTTNLTFGGTLPTINVTVRPQLNNTWIGPVILEGPVFGTPS